MWAGFHFVDASLICRVSFWACTWGFTTANDTRWRNTVHHMGWQCAVIMSLSPEQWVKN